MLRGVKCWASGISLFGVGCLALFALRVSQDHRSEDTILNKWQSSTQEQNVVLLEPKEEIFINEPFETKIMTTTKTTTESNDNLLTSPQTTTSTSTSTSTTTTSTPTTTTSTIGLSSKSENINMNIKNEDKNSSIADFPLWLEEVETIPFKPLPSVWSTWNFINSSSSQVSFAMLAFDILYLHTLQQVAAAEDRVSELHLRRDPEAIALHALFLPAAQASRLESDAEDQPPEPEALQPNNGFLEDILYFASSGLRALGTLTRAFKSSTLTLSSPLPVDCLWTLYCRNLGTAIRTLPGTFSILAKLNSLGLRVLLGDLPLDRLLAIGLEELKWPEPLSCHKLFPKCTPDRAVQIVLAAASTPSLTNPTDE